MKIKNKLFIDKKDAYYFSHDANARHDPKIQAMRTIYGSEGYGWFWILIELMREQKDYKLQLTGKHVLAFLARELETDKEKANQFINDCQKEFCLFDSDGDFFWNNSLVKRMEYKSLLAKNASDARWKGHRKSADALQMQNRRNAIKRNETKENKMKGNGKEKENICRNDKSFRLAFLLLSSIRSFHPEFKEPNLEKWSQEIDNIIRLDERNPIDLELIIRQLPGLSFWRGKIMTPNSLRRNFDNLIVALNLNGCDENERYYLLRDEINEKYIRALDRLDEEERAIRPVIN